MFIHAQIMLMVHWYPKGLRPKIFHTLA